MLHKEQMRVGNLQVQMTRKGAEEQSIITDVAVLVTRQQKEIFLNHFTQKNISLQKDCYTGLLKRGLVNYSHHKKFSDHHPYAQFEEKINTFLEKKIAPCLRPCAKLERLVNNPIEGDCFVRLAHLKKEAIACKDALLDIVSDNSNPHAIKLQTTLENNFDQFIHQIKLLEENTPTAEELQQLFCSQDGAISGSTSIKSLGSLLGTQLHLIAGYSIDEIYRLTDNRLQQAFIMHPAIKALSDAKASLELRALSAKGAREENSQTPVPRQLLDLIDSPEEEEKDGEQKWLSLTPYVTQLQEVEEINKMLFLLSAADSSQQFNNARFNWGGSAWLAVSSFWEVILSIVHIVLSMISFGFEVILCWPINILSNYKLGMKWFDNLVTWAHARLSFVVSCKNALRESYTQQYQEKKKFLDYLWKNKTDTSSLSLDSEIEQIRADTDNILNALLSEYSGHRTAAIFGHWLKEIVKVFYDIGMEFKFLLFVRSTPENRYKAFSQKKDGINRHKTILLERLEDKLSKITLTNHSDLEPKEEAIEEIKQNPSLLWQPGVPWLPNEFSSILDVPDELLSGVADQFIEKMFRHNPGTSTLSFMSSMISFGVLMAPTASANANIAWMGYLADFLSKHFTGKAVSEGSLTKLLSVFLQWKLEVLTVEVITELSLGNFEFLRATFKDLDHTALMLVVLTSLGSSLEVFGHHPIPADFHLDLVDPHVHPWLNQYIQLSVNVCSMMPHLINTLGEEAAFCSHGTVPLRYLEELVLGLKLALIVQSALSSPQRAKTLDINKVFDSLTANLITLYEKLKRIADPEKKIVITELLAQQNIYLPQSLEAQKQYNTLVQSLVSCLDPNNSIVRQRKAFAAINTPAKRSLQGRITGKSESKLDKAHLQLKTALDLVNEMECFGSSGFQEKEDAWYFSDYLSECFDNYINELDKLGRGTQEERYLQKRYLASFDNKYCDNSVVGIMKLFSIIPFYPVTLIWRATKYVVSKSPCIRNEVIKSFSKDMAMLIQLPIALLRPIRSLIRSISYLLRFSLGTTAVILCSPLLLGFCLAGYTADAIDVINRIVKFTTLINFHRFNGTKWLRAIYAKLSLNCNTSHEKDYLDFWEQAVFKKLNANKAVSQQPEENSNDLIDTLLKEHPTNYCLPRRLLLSTDAMQRALSVCNSTSLEKNEKQTKLCTIFKINTERSVVGSNPSLPGLSIFYSS